MRRLRRRRKRKPETGSKRGSRSADSQPADSSLPNPHFSSASTLWTELEGHRPRCPRVAGGCEPRGTRPHVYNQKSNAPSPLPKTRFDVERFEVAPAPSLARRQLRVCPCRFRNIVKRAAHAAAVQEFRRVRVALGCPHIRVPQKIHRRPNIRSAFKQVCGERVPQGVWRRPLHTSVLPPPDTRPQGPPEDAGPPLRSERPAPAGNPGET